MSNSTRKVATNLLCFLALLFIYWACKTTGKHRQTSTLAGDTSLPSGSPVDLCNDEKLDLYYATSLGTGLLSIYEISRQIDGWNPIPPGTCVPAKNYWGPSFRIGLRTYEGEAIIYLSGLSTEYRPGGSSLVELITPDCMPKRTAKMESRGLTPVTINTFSQQAFCPGTHLPVTSYYDVYPLKTVKGDRIEYRFRNGSFSSRAIDKPAELSWEEKIHEVEKQIEDIDKKIKDCGVQIDALMARDIFQIKVEEIREAGRRCDQVTQAETLVKSITTFVGTAMAKVAALSKQLVEKIGMYKGILAKLGLSEIVDSTFQQAGVENLRGAAAEQTADAGSEGYFQRLQNLYQMNIASSYLKDQRATLLSVMSFSEVFSHYGDEMVSEQNKRTKERFLGYLDATGDFNQYVGTLELERGDFGPDISPEVQNAVLNEIQPRFPAEGTLLAQALKKYSGKLTEEQIAKIQTIAALGDFVKQAFTSGIENARVVQNRLRDVTSNTIKFLEQGIICPAGSVALGDFVDWYEIISGKTFCGDEEIGIAGRLISVGGLVIGSSKAWRFAAEHTGVKDALKVVFREAEEVTEVAVKAGYRDKKAFSEVSEFVKTGLPCKFAADIHFIDLLLRSIEGVAFADDTKCFGGIFKDRMKETIASLEKWEVKPDRFNDITNQISHFFGTNLEEHKLGGVLAAYGGDYVEAYMSIKKVAQGLVDSGELKEGKVFTKLAINIKGIDMTIQGRVIAGEARLSTGFIPR